MRGVLRGRNGEGNARNAEGDEADATEASRLGCQVTLAGQTRNGRGPLFQEARFDLRPRAYCDPFKSCVICDKRLSRLSSGYTAVAQPEMTIERLLSCRLARSICRHRLCFLFRAKSHEFSGFYLFRRSRARQNGVHNDKEASKGSTTKGKLILALRTKRTMQCKALSGRNTIRKLSRRCPAIQTMTRTHSAKPRSIDESSSLNEGAYYCTFRCRSKPSEHSSVGSSSRFPNLFSLNAISRLQHHINAIFGIRLQVMYLPRLRRLNERVSIPASASSL